MVGLVLLVIVAHLGMAAVEVPALWGGQNRRPELWTVIGLLLLGLGLGLMVVLDYRPISVFKLIEAIFKPIGTVLFKAKGG